jgi:RNA recognition motif-containing protein
MSTRLHVGNLATETTEETLRTLFASDGRRVDEVSVVTDRATGRSRGFCFVQMGSSEDAVAAIAAVNGREVDGRRLSVSEARSRSEQERL